MTFDKFYFKRQHNFIRTVLIVSVRITVFNATFNNISVISWRSVLLVDVEKNTDHLMLVADKLSHYVLPSTPRHEWDSKSQL